jgi:hypothetical protein
MKNLLKTLVIGIFFAILGHCLAGCDGASDGPDKVNPCEGANVVVVVTVNGVQPAQMMLNLCVGWAAAKQYGGVDACVTELSKTLGRVAATEECHTSMTVTECKDEAHNFVDSAGVTHWYGVSETAGYTMAITSFGLGAVGNTPPTNTPTPICTAKGQYGVCLEGCH